MSCDLFTANSTIHVTMKRKEQRDDIGKSNWLVFMVVLRKFPPVCPTVTSLSCQKIPKRYQKRWSLATCLKHCVFRHLSDLWLAERIFRFFLLISFSPYFLKLFKNYIFRYFVDWDFTISPSLRIRMWFNFIALTLLRFVVHCDWMWRKRKNSNLN